MNGYKLNNGQKNALTQQNISERHYFNPVKDIDGNWFIFQQEMDSVVKNKGWQKIMKAEYIPPQQNEI